MTTRFQQLNIEDIAIAPLQDSSFIPSQRIAWISSNTTNSRLLIQSPEFSMFPVVMFRTRPSVEPAYRSQIGWIFQSSVVVNLIYTIYTYIYL